MNINLPGIITLAVVLLNLFFLKFLFEQKKGNKGNKFYLSIMISIVISWQFFILINRIFDTGEYSLYLWRISAALLTWGTIYPFFLFANFLNITIKKWIKYALYSLGSFVSLIALFTNLIFSDTELFWWGREAVQGPYFFIIYVLLSVFFALSAYLLIQGYIHTKNTNTKRAIVIIVIGFLINIVSGITLESISTFIGEPFPSLSGVSSTFVNLALLIAIYRFSFMHIRPRRFTIGQKLFISFTLISIIVISSLSYVTFHVGKQILEEKTVSNIEKINTLKEFEMLRYSNGEDLSREELGVVLNNFGNNLVSEINKEVSSEQTSKLRDSITMISFMVFILIVLVTIFLERRITRRVNDLRNAALKISKGKLNTKVKVVLKDEIGDLAHAFNQMTQNLKEAKEEIDKYNRTLERKVKSRTIELQREQEKLKITLESIGDGALVIDNKGVISLFNRMAEKMTLYSGSDVLGEKYEKVLKLINEKTQKKNNEFINEAIKKKKASFISNHTVLINKKNEEIPIIASAAPIYDPTKKKVDSAIVTFRDISAQREIDKMKDDFISLVSHQLRTPLTVIKWSLESMMQSKKKASQRLEKHNVANLYDATLRMNTLINMILNISRIESGNLLIKPEEVNFAHEAKSVIDELTTLASKKNQSIVLNSKNSIPVIKTDQKVLREIITNLVSNAIKYTLEGGKIEVNISHKKKYIEVEVKDNGIGIPEKAQAQIFQRFFRAMNAIKTENVGTGLGLAIIKNLVEMLGGKIWFKSKENKGTSFYFKLPVAGVKARKGAKGLV